MKICLEALFVAQHTWQVAQHIWKVACANEMFIVAIMACEIKMVNAASEFIACMDQAIVAHMAKVTVAHVACQIMTHMA